MKTLIDLISQPWLGSLLGILGLGAAIFFYFRSRKVSRLAFQSDRVTLVGSANSAFPKELEIRFSGTSVPRVTAERIVIWNAGNNTLGGQQIVSSDPLRVEIAEGSEILKIDVLKSTREVTALRLTHREGSKRIADICFDYLDPGDGMLFEILHSGGRADLEILGTLRGIPSGLKDYGRVLWFFNRNFKPYPFNRLRWTMVIILLLGLGSMIYGLFRPYLLHLFPSLTEQLIKPADTTKPLWVAVVLGVLYTATPAWLLWKSRKRYPSSLDIDSSVKADSDKDGRRKADIPN